MYVCYKIKINKKSGIQPQKKKILKVSLFEFNDPLKCYAEKRRKSSQKKITADNFFEQLL
jgi:hypothetical protein